MIALVSSSSQCLPGTHVSGAQLPGAASCMAKVTDDGSWTLPTVTALHLGGTAAPAAMLEGAPRGREENCAFFIYTVSFTYSQVLEFVETVQLHKVQFSSIRCCVSANTAVAG